MAYRQDGPYVAFPAGADFSALDPQYLAVTIDTNGLIQINTVSGGRVLGILQDTPKAAGTATVQHRDVTKWAAAASFAIGTLLQSDGNGKAIAATSTGKIVGMALQAGASGRTIAVLLNGGNQGFNALT